MNKQPSKVTRGLVFRDKRLWQRGLDVYGELVVAIVGSSCISVPLTSWVSGISPWFGILTATALLAACIPIVLVSICGFGLLLPKLVYSRL
jgi:hypothetical protein